MSMVTYKTGAYGHWRQVGLSLTGTPGHELLEMTGDVLWSCPEPFHVQPLPTSEVFKSTDLGKTEVLFKHLQGVCGS